ncbi:hypothetical protein HOB10_04935 [Candidatus Parcubacteria bacterium]|jgi:hypothetical protein|nr:hypothetical protein [Candidatus Parcubacteria bacterium]
MIFTTNDKGKILLLAVLVVIFLGFIFWQWLNFLPVQKDNRSADQNFFWQGLSQEATGVMGQIKDGVDLGLIRLGILEDEFKRQARQDAVVDAFKLHISGQATSTDHMCNDFLDCGEGASCLVEVSDEDWDNAKDGEILSHFARNTFCHPNEDLLGCLFYAEDGGDILQICAD